MSSTIPEHSASTRSSGAPWADCRVCACELLISLLGATVSPRRERNGYKALGGIQSKIEDKAVQNFAFSEPSLCKLSTLPELVSPQSFSFLAQIVSQRMLLVEWQSHCNRRWSGEVRYGCRNGRHCWAHCGGLCRGLAYEFGGNAKGVATSVSVTTSTNQRDSGTRTAPKRRQQR